MNMPRKARTLTHAPYAGANHDYVAFISCRRTLTHAPYAGANLTSSTTGPLHETLTHAPYAGANLGAAFMFIIGLKL